MTPTKTSKIAKALLDGDVITMMDGFKRFGITNLSREISRQIERKFGVQVSKDKVDFTHDCGLPGWYFRYRLNRIPENEKGIFDMRQYVEENGLSGIPPKRRVGRPKETLAPIDNVKKLF